MADAMRVFGVGSKVEYQGKTYSLSPLNYGMIAKFEQWLEDQAWQAAMRRKGKMPDEMYNQLIKTTLELVTSEHYKFGGEAAAKASQSFDGRAVLLHLMLQEKHPEVSLEFARDLLAHDLMEMVAKMAAADHDPNAAAPATGAHS